MDEVPQETLSATAELHAEALPAIPSVVPPTEAGKDPRGVKLLPCPGKWGTCPGEVPPMAVPVLPAPLQMPAEQPHQLVPRGTCLIHNWQEEVTPHHHLGGGGGGGGTGENAPQNPPHHIPHADPVKPPTPGQPTL